MAEQETTTTDPAAEGEETEVATHAGLIGKIKIAAFLLVVIAVECAAAYMFIPSANDTAAMAQALIAAANGEDEIEDEFAADEEDQEIPRIEVDMGEFSITSYQPVTNTTLRIDFHLYATVLETEGDDFQLRFVDNQQRVRDQVLVTLRSSEETDLTDPGLGLIKRKILETTNRALGRPLLQEIIFSEFSLVEQ